MTTVHYLVGKVLGARPALEQISKLMDLFDVAPVTRPVLEGALRSGFADFEDAVLHEAALHIGAQALITRDANGFKGAKIPVYSPDELISTLALHIPRRGLE